MGDIADEAGRDDTVLAWRFRELDTDGDGLLSKAELLAFIRTPRFGLLSPSDEKLFVNTVSSEDTTDGVPKYSLYSVVELVAQYAPKSSHGDDTRANVLRELRSKRAP